MSQIPTSQIDGDVAVGRNVSAGGKATIRGSVTIGHNLKVEGWLEAPNIKEANKGLFETPETLRAVYPNPADGWWAVVSNDNPDPAKYMGRVYMGRDGVWVDCVNAEGSAKYAGNSSLDAYSITEEVGQIAGSLDQVTQEVVANARSITALQRKQDTFEKTVAEELDKVKKAATYTFAFDAANRVLTITADNGNGQSVIIPEGEYPGGSDTTRIDCISALEIMNLFT